MILCHLLFGLPSGLLPSVFQTVTKETTPNKVRNVQKAKSAVLGILFNSIPSLKCVKQFVQYSSLFALSVFRRM